VWLLMKVIMYIGNSYIIGLKIDDMYILNGSLGSSIDYLARVLKQISTLRRCSLLSTVT